MRSNWRAAPPKSPDMIPLTHSARRIIRHAALPGPRRPGQPLEGGRTTVRKARRLASPDGCDGSFGCFFATVQVYVPTMALRVIDRAIQAPTYPVALNRRRQAPVRSAAHLLLSTVTLQQLCAEKARTCRRMVGWACAKTRSCRWLTRTCARCALPTDPMRCVHVCARARVCACACARLHVREKLDRRGVHATKRAPASAFVWKRLVRLLHLRPCAAVCAHIARGRATQAVPQGAGSAGAPRNDRQRGDPPPAQHAEPRQALVGAPCWCVRSLD